MESHEMADQEDEQTHSIHQQEPLAANFVIKKPKHSVSLKFDNVVYKTKTKKPKSFFSRKTSPKKKEEDDNERLILKGIKGEVLPAEMLVILGPSGSGKTTLLTALGGRKFSNGQLSGTITYNGEPFSHSMNRNIGFVSQDDNFHVHLTVTETLLFTALLRLPKTLKHQEKILKVEEVINKLGLTSCKDTIMGGLFLRGVSGGERKRVSIGQELLMNPNLLFLDEPTSGLDSTSAQQIVSMLWELATEGAKTVLMSIHQPSGRLFYMFQKVLLLSDGYPLYFGKGEETMDYFSRIGFAPTFAMNPADFLLDLANGVYLDNLDVESKEALKQSLVMAYKSNIFVNEEIKVETENGQIFGQWRTTWSQQFLVLLRRDLRERRHQAFSRLKVVQSLFISFLCGLLWWRSSVSHLEDQIGLLFFSCLYWSLIPLFDAIFTFPLEKKMLIKERSSSMYRLSSYFIARTIGDLPMELALPTIYVIIIYWMGGLKPTPTNFFKTLVVILNTSLVSQSTGLAIGAVLMKLRSGTITAAILSETLLLVSGFYVEHIPSFISWMKFLSGSYYSYKLLLWSQYKSDDTYPCGLNGTCKVGDYHDIKRIGLGDEAMSFVALGLMFVGYRIIAYVALMRIGVTR